MGKATEAYVEVEMGEACPLFPPRIRARGHTHHHLQIVEVSCTAVWVVLGRGGRACYAWGAARAACKLCELC
jgi:hypothetical protein